MKRIIFTLITISTLNSIYACADYDTQLEGYDTPILYAPWRDSFLKNIDTPKEKKSCPFCGEMQYTEGVNNFILRTFKHCVVMLNLFPYAKGHLLIMPREHTGQLENLSSDTRAEMMEIANESLKVLKYVYGISGANVGFNLGRIAGASIPDHLHMHVVPRSTVPYAFIQVIGRTEVACFDMDNVYAELKPEFDKIELP